MVAARQASKKKPRTYGDYREMLEEKDLDIVLIAHARPLARPADDRRRRGRRRRLRARSRSAWTWSRARRCSPPPASTSGSCRSARSGAARRTSIEARDRIVKRGQARQGRARRDLLLLPHARRRQSARHARRRSISTTRCGPAPPRCGPYNALVHPRGWRAFMEYGNGIVGDMCIHMLDMVRWMLDLGWPKRIASTRRHPGRQGQQGEHHRHPDGDVRLRRPEGRLAAPHLGRPRPTRSIPGARPSTATRARSRRA